MFPNNNHIINSALLPDCILNVLPHDMPENCELLEELRWQPNLSDCDLMMYLRAARSVSAFAAMCENGGSVGDGCVTASRDDTTINALEILHENEYNTSKALEALVLKPTSKGIDKKWTDDEQKRFIKGLRQYGKDFHKIRTELLAHKETSDLVEFYYLWKKTQQAATIRPHRRRRGSSMKRNRSNNSATNNANSNNGNSKNSNLTATVSQNNVVSSTNDYLSSGSEDNEDEGLSVEDDSDSTVGNSICQHCLTCTAKDFQPVGKDNALLCTDCRIFYKKNGEYRPLDSLQIENNKLLNSKNSLNDQNGSKMQTRRSKESGGKESGFKIKKENNSEPDSPTTILEEQNSDQNSDQLTSSSNETQKTNLTETNSSYETALAIKKQTQSTDSPKSKKT